MNSFIVVTVVEGGHSFDPRTVNETLISGVAFCKILKQRVNEKSRAWLSLSCHVGHAGSAAGTPQMRVRERPDHAASFPGDWVMRDFFQIKQASVPLFPISYDPNARVGF